MNDNKKHGIGWISVLLLIVIAFAGLLTVECSIEQYEKTYRVKLLTAELEYEQNEGELLKIEYEKRTNYHDVEDYAINTLGMRKLNKYQIEYIVSTNTNTTQLIMADEDDTGVLSRITTAFAVILEYFD